MRHDTLDRIVRALAFKGPARKRSKRAAKKADKQEFIKILKEL